MNKNGFTLIEILVTILIFSFASLAIIMTITSTMHENVKSNTVLNRANLMEKAMEEVQGYSKLSFPDGSMGYDSLLNKSIGEQIYEDSQAAYKIFATIDSFVPNVASSNNYIVIKLHFLSGGSNSDSSTMCFKLSKFK